MKEKLNLTLEKEIKEKLEDISKDNGLSKSAMVTILINNYKRR